MCECARGRYGWEGHKELSSEKTFSKCFRHFNKDCMSLSRTNLISPLFKAMDSPTCYVLLVCCFVVVWFMFLCCFVVVWFMFLCCFVVVGFMCVFSLFLCVFFHCSCVCVWLVNCVFHLCFLVVCFI